VSFGLLTAGDLFRALERDPKTPRTRKLLAVPFVGKDVPSPASEFAHPDVVIGMTVLAYRYEGLRWGDFQLVMRRAVLGVHCSPCGRAILASGVASLLTPFKGSCYARRCSSLYTSSSACAQS
jgi:hypothetical protein